MEARPRPPETACDGRSTTSDERDLMFLFFSNRLGCLGSILVSVIVTAIVIFLLRAF